MTKNPNFDSKKQRWLKELKQAVEEGITDSTFNTNALAEKLSLSRSQLYRRLQEELGVTPSEYIREIRLTKAYELFENKIYNSVKAVALSVGYVHRSSFAEHFKKRFGRLPSEMLY